MKKKSILLTVCTVMVVLVTIVLLVFAFGGDKEKESGTNGNESISLTGTWIIAANFSGDKPIYNENQYIEFVDEKVSMYKENVSNPYVESRYEVDSTNQLVLADISRNYMIASKTNNCIRLYDTKDSYMLLIRNNTNDKEQLLVTEDDLQGEWNIVLKAEDINNGEKMIFNGDNLDYYKDSNDKPTASTKYIVKEGTLIAESLGMTLKCYKTGDNHLVFIDQNGIVWELAK